MVLWDKRCLQALTLHCIITINVIDCQAHVWFPDSTWPKVSSGGKVLHSPEIPFNTPWMFCMQLRQCCFGKKLCKEILYLLFNMSSTYQKPLLLKVFIGDVPLTKRNTVATVTSLCPFRWTQSANLTMDVLADAGPSALATNGQLLVGLQAFTTLCILRYLKKTFVLHHCRLLFFKFLSYLNAIWVTNLAGYIIVNIIIF